METLSEFLGGRSLHRTFRECNRPADVAAPGGGPVFTSVSSYRLINAGMGTGRNTLPARHCGRSGG